MEEFGRDLAWERPEEWLLGSWAFEEAVQDQKLEFWIVSQKLWSVNIMAFNLMGSEVHKFISSEVVS
jgi:hypothetical protein